MSAPPFFTRYGITRSAEPGAPLEIEPYGAVLHRGSLRRTVLASAIDIVGSYYTREAAGSDIAFTTDLSLRAPRLGAPQRLVARGAVLRAGRTLVTTGVTFEADGEPCAYGETTFMRAPRRDGAEVDPATLGLPPLIESAPLGRPLVDEVGIEDVDPASGAIRVALHEALLNGEGGMQGALVALLCEVAAERFAEHAHGGPRVVTGLDLRYLAAGRVGPITSRAAWVDGPAGGALRVELRDRGNGDRLTTAALAQTAAASG